ncbi:conserved Plasmodium protein, unknown function [Plasmodium sp. gorilla clade G1]|nr:conserved Plasmodium protein, unknown function [Plasmodium sp. gorilla clade G1]
MELKKYIGFFLFIFLICPIKTFILKNNNNLSPYIIYLRHQNKNRLNVKINDIINFKDKNELRKEIITHSKKLCLHLNEEQLRNIENNLYEFFNNLKLRNINIDLDEKKIKENKENIKSLPLVEHEKIQEKFQTKNLKKEGDYFVIDSNSLSD